MSLRSVSTAQKTARRTFATTLLDQFAELDEGSVHALMCVAFNAFALDPMFALQQSSCKGLKQHGLYVLHAVLEILLRGLGKVHTLVCVQKLLQYKMHAAFDIHQNI